MIQIQGGRKIPPHVGYGNRDANGDLRPRALSNKNCMFPFSYAGGGLTGIRTQSMLGHSTTLA